MKERIRIQFPLSLRQRLALILWRRLIVDVDVLRDITIDDLDKMEGQNETKTDGL